MIKTLLDIFLALLLIFGIIVLASSIIITIASTIEKSHEKDIKEEFINKMMIEFTTATPEKRKELMKNAHDLKNIAEKSKRNDK